MSRRPNILYIIADQQAANAMSCAGNPDLRTPALDSLAAHGRRFDLAYCTHPICTASRASMMTGQVPHVLRAAAEAQPATPPAVLGRLIGAAGYDCVYGGKWGVPGAPMPEDHGFRTLCPMNDHELAGRCIDFLRNGRDPRRPFFMVASFDNPHNICEWARQQPLPWGSIPEAPLEECPTLPPNFPIPPYEPDILRVEQSFNPKVYPSVRFNEDRWRQYRHAYFRLCEKVDLQIGRILDALRAQGLEEETLVVFSSDHGDGQGAHRWNQKTVLYEEVARVPLIVSWKGVTEAGVDRAHLVSNGLDLLPTLCDYAGAEAPAGLPGRSLRPLAEGRESATPSPQDWRPWLTCETHFTHAAGRMVRTLDYKYIVYSMGQHREQLFHMESDPGEMVNLAGSARHRATLNWFRRTLAQWRDETADYFPVPECG